MNTFDLALDLDKRAGVTQWVTLRQGDHNGTVLKATIYDHGVQVGGGYTCRVSIRIAGSGDEYYRETANYSNGVATVTIDEQYAAAVVGITYGYFELLQGSAVIASTESFGVRVLQSAQEGAVPGDKYDSAIEDALAELDEATGRISQMVVDATEEYLEAHPEITTTVQDNSLTDAKLVQKGGILQREQWLETMLPNIPKKATSESDVHSVTDSAGGGPLGIEVYGRSTQDGTPTPDAPVPIQSVTPNLYQQTMYAAGGTRKTAGITVTYNEDGTCTCSGTATANAWMWGSSSSADDRFYVELPAGTYTVSGSHYVAVQKKVGDTVSSLVGTQSAPVTFTLTEPTLVKAVPVISNGTTVDNARVWVAVYTGTLPQPYVPYNNVGLLSHNANLYRQTLYTSGTQDRSGVTYTYLDGGSFTASGTATSNATSWGGTSTVHSGVFVYVPAGTYTAHAPSPYGIIVRKLVNGDNTAIGSSASGTVTFTLTEETLVLCYAYIPSGTTVTDAYGWVMLTAGSTPATEYVPYAESTIPIDLQGHVLRSLPNGTRDEVTVDQYGHATLTQRVGAVTYDGSEAWSTLQTVEGVRDFYRNEPTARERQYAPTLLCNVALGATAVAVQRDRVTVGSGSTMILAIGDTLGISTVDAFKTWLASNHVTVQFALATPVTIDLGYLDPALLPAPDLTAHVVPSAPSVLRYGFDVAAAIAEIATA